MIDKQKLKEIMQFVIKEYPDGCASYNWQNDDHIDIIKENRQIEDYEIENIIEDCMNEFTYEDLKLCGCGSPEKTWEIIRLILIAQNQDKWEDKKNKFSDICNVNIEDNDNYNGLIQFVLYVLDDHEFLEHSSSIGGAWLTEKDKLFLDLLNMRNEIDDSNLDK